MGISLWVTIDGIAKATRVWLGFIMFFSLTLPLSLASVPILPGRARRGQQRVCIYHSFPFWVIFLSYDNEKNLVLFFSSLFPLGWWNGEGELASSR
ncbi:hypothetical protein BS50DRAFT_3065 [Corynespora cassiicola Philippines]|uniref:Uncharacterized protein n=1 Tax=Corynespora cassiicola Philippines TaxID=1448308 RepID=A0A2T2P8A5_CORCC|nr:hypothetical protein BS50DRAFT_3065 [Corynespora cassiicola Philippines]